MEDIVESYVEELTESKEFQRLIELKKIIDSKYALLIISFKTKESYYSMALDNPSIYNVEEKKKELLEAKTKLYSKEEVKEYFALEAKINQRLEEDMNDLKESISNKFLKTKSLFI